MRPIAHADGHDFPRHVNELVPSETAVVENVVVAVRDPKIMGSGVIGQARLQNSAAGLLDVEGAPNPKVF
jgi:hypothetical protein